MNPSESFPQKEFDEEASKLDILLTKASCFFMRQIRLENPNWDRKEFSEQYEESCFMCLRKEIRKNLVTKEYVSFYCGKNISLFFEEYSKMYQKGTHKPTPPSDK